MIGYQPAQWHDLFVAVADAAAALAGLIFVAVALNHDQILTLPRLASLAARSVSVLVALVLLCIFGLVPGQEHEILGAEILVLGVPLLVGVLAATLRALTKQMPMRWRLSLISAALISSVPMVVGGLSTMIGIGGGLYWVVAEIVCGIVVSTWYAWILLIEIRR